MGQLDRSTFSEYVREQWSRSGGEVGEEGDAPYKEMVKVDGSWGFSLSVFRDGVKGRAGIWFLPPGGSIGDLGTLRNHYQQTLQRQNRFVRISNCGTELGSFYLFWEATQPLPQEKWNTWVKLVEDCNSLCFDPDSLDLFLESFR